jgi:hypothetical protein
MKDKEKDKRLLIPKDEFGEEAADGLGRLSRDEAAEDLRELKGRMERRLRKPRMIWLPAAAAVVTVLVASALYVSLFRDRGEEPAVAMADKKMKDSASVVLAEEGETDTVFIAMAKPIEKSGDAAGSAGRESMRRPDMATSEAVPPPPPEEVTAAGVPLIVETDDEVLEVVAEAQSEEPGAERVIVEATQLPKGKVPAGEEVIVEALPTVQQEEAVAEEAIVEALPMMQKAALRTDDAKKEKAAPRPAAAGTQGAVVPDREAAPVGGQDEFRKWITRNIRYPEGVDPVVHQVIVVTFRVRADSTIYDLKAERTAGDLFTREAFRLIREGPKWQPAIRGGQVVEEEVRVSIVFR